MQTQNRFLLGIVLVGLMSIAAAGCRSASEAERFVARWRLLFDSHDLSGFTALYAADGAYTAPGMVFPARSPDQLRGVLETLWRSSPDMRVSAVRDVVADGERIVFVWEITGTPAFAMRPTKTVGATFIHLADGKIREQLTITSR